MTTCREKWVRRVVAIHERHRNGRAIRTVPEVRA
jgi:hypothetical protein